MAGERKARGLEAVRVAAGHVVAAAAADSMAWTLSMVVAAVQVEAVVVCCMSVVAEDMVRMPRIVKLGLADMYVFSGFAYQLVY